MALNRNWITYVYGAEERFPCVNVHKTKLFVFSRSIKQLSIKYICMQAMNV